LALLSGVLGFKIYVSLRTADFCIELSKLYSVFLYQGAVLN